MDDLIIRVSRQGQAAKLTEEISNELEVWMASSEPVTSFSMGPAAFLTSGKVGNFTDAVIVLLGTVTSVCGESPDTIDGVSVERIYCAYKKHRETLFELLDGSYALCIYDIIENTLVAAVDRVSSLPLFYIFEENFIIISTRIEHIFHEIAAPISINESMLLDYLFGEITNSTETFYEQVNKIPRSSYLVCRGMHTKLNEYLDFQFRSLTNDNISERAEFVVSFGEIFNKTLHAMLKADLHHSIGVSISGGIDSSSILCSILKNSIVASPRAYGLIFLSDIFAEVNERNLIEEIKNYYGIEIQYIVGDRTTPLNDICAYDEFLINGPSVDSSLLPLLEISSRASEDGVNVLYSGMGAEIFIGSRLFYYDLFLSGQLSRILRALRLDSVPWWKVAFWNVLVPLVGSVNQTVRSPYIPTWLNSDFVLESDHMSRVKGMRRRTDLEQSSSQYMFECYINPNLEWSLVFQSMISKKYSIPMRNPYLAKDMIECAFSIPPEYLFGQDGSKGILRDAMGGVVPRQIIEKTVPVTYDIFFVEGLKNNQLLVRDIIHQSTLAKMKIIDAEAVNALLDALFCGEFRCQGELWRMVSSELWLDFLSRESGSLISVVNPGKGILRRAFQ